jgi:hypothetical protein
VVRLSLSASDVTAVLVTRGDVDLTPVLESLPFEEVIIWDNSKRYNESVYGRYLAIREAKHRIIYTQDDDCVVDVAKVLDAYEPGVVTCNMPDSRWIEYSRCALVGWGSVFDADLWFQAERRYLSAGHEWDELYKNEVDRVFTALNRRKLIDLPFEHLPHAHGSDRMWKRRNHLADRARILDRIHGLTVRSA